MKLRHYVVTVEAREGLTKKKQGQWIKSDLAGYWAGLRVKPIALGARKKNR